MNTIDVERCVKAVLCDIRALAPFEAQEVLKRALETVESAGTQYDKALGFNS